MHRSPPLSSARRQTLLHQTSYRCCSRTDSCSQKMPPVRRSIRSGCPDRSRLRPTAGCYPHTSGRLRSRPSIPADCLSSGIRDRFRYVVRKCAACQGSLSYRPSLALPHFPAPCAPLPQRNFHKSSPLHPQGAAAVYHSPFGTG